MEKKAEAYKKYNGASQISGNMPIVMKQVFDTMSEATGVDFTEIMRAGTYDAKVNRNINLSGEAVKVNVSEAKPAE